MRPAYRISDTLANIECLRGHRICDTVLAMSTQTTRETVATEVLVTLTRRHMSRAELARRIRMSRGALTARLRAEHAFDTDELDQIGEVLGVDPWEFYKSSAPASLVTQGHRISDRRAA